MQTTLKSAIYLEGVGLHSGKLANMTLHPAAPDHGITFCRTDLASPDNVIPASWDLVRQSPLCTLLENGSGATLSTVEHVMAALAGCGVHNAQIDIDGPEVPILDGSSAPFVRAILKAGVHVQNAPLRAIEVLKSVEVRDGDAVARLEPARNLFIDFSIDFSDAAIGTQEKSLNLANGTFVHELCDSRTFCRQSDVEAMHKAGLALGGTYENAVVVDGDQVLSPGGLRHSDEAVRHKMLDALGDLALAGAPILGRYIGHRSGHAMTNKLLRALLGDASNYRFVACDDLAINRMPGAGLSIADSPEVLDFVA